ncbi:DUF7424 family protein [Lonepinella sp. BR2919]|uniref:DUF7424 family protein n=1 Tax=unclassified Lonepinella TaxID=2642006 RepID=UPI003F6DFF8C
MKKLLALSCCALALSACKTQVEKDVSLSTLLNEPIKTETALLNVEISSCSDREDSRKPSDALIKIQAKIPNVFEHAKYKECFSKRMNSFASFEIPIGIGKVDDGTTLENDINIYSYKNRQLNVKTTDKLAKNIRDFVEREYISNLDFEILIHLKNDTDSNHSFNVYSAYINNDPWAVLPNAILKKGEEWNIRLSNSSADALWRYEKFNPTVYVLSSPFSIDEVTTPKE